MEQKTAKFLFTNNLKVQLKLAFFVANEGQVRWNIFCAIFDAKNGWIENSLAKLAARNWIKLFNDTLLSEELNPATLLLLISTFFFKMAYKIQKMWTKTTELIRWMGFLLMPLTTLYDKFILSKFSQKNCVEAVKTISNALKT